MHLPVRLATHGMRALAVVDGCLILFAVTDALVGQRREAIAVLWRVIGR